MKKNLALIKININSILTYRFRMLVWFLVGLIQVLVFPFIWLAAFGEQNILAGFSQAEIVTYFIGVAVANTIVISHIEEWINREIRDGELSKYLPRPVSYLAMKMAHESTYRFLSGVYFMPAIILGIVIFKNYFYLNTNPLIIITTIISLILAHIICYLLTHLVGLAAFWLEEASSLQDLFWIIFFLFSGQFAPLTFFPEILQTIANFLPFKYILYFPINLYLNKLSFGEILIGLGIQLLWIAVVLLGYKIIWTQGLKRYQAVGN